MNEHVYKYFRWKGWIAKEHKRHLASFFFYDFARQERELSLKLNVDIPLFI